MKKFILASSSIPRKEILLKTGIAFKVEASNYKEDMTLSLEPKELAMHLSKGKARDVASRNRDAVILGADSFAVYDGQLLGKPYTTKRAKEMLTMLSGQVHSFVTGFTIIDTTSSREYSEAVETKVYFRKLSSSEIDSYLAKENVLNNAGAYIMQSLGAVLIEKIEGSYTNVTGLPLSHVAQALSKFGIHIL